MRQMRERGANVPMLCMFYAAQPQFPGVGDDAESLYSQTLARNLQ